MKAKVLVVDDETLARDRLRQLIALEPGVELAGECADGPSAVEAIKTLKPDVVFLDINIPDLDGFGVIEQLDEKCRPAIVFVTAYNQFALKAFEVHAVDYLLKPFDRERFQKALGRALERVTHRGEPGLQPSQTAFLSEMRKPAKLLERIPVKSTGKVIFVKVEEIDWVEAAQNYVELHVGKHSHLLRETLASFEARLPAEKFVRIGRSVIVNIERIKELQPLFYGEYRVTLQDGTKLTLSRRFRDKLQQLGLK